MVCTTRPVYQRSVLRVNCTSRDPRIVVEVRMHVEIPPYDARC